LHVVALNALYLFFGFLPSAALVGGIDRAKTRCVLCVCHSAW
jgi:hypothetical protein